MGRQSGGESEGRTEQREQTRGWLSLDAKGELVVVDDAVGCGWSLLRGANAQTGGCSARETPSASSLPMGVSTSPLPSARGRRPLPSPPLPFGGAEGGARARDSLERDGFVLLHGLIPDAKVERAIRFLNHHLGSADLPLDLDPSGLGSEFLGSDLVGSEFQAARAGAELAVVKLGSGRKCTCSMAQAAPLLALIGADERDAISRLLEPPEDLDKGKRREREYRISPQIGCQVALRFPLSPPARGLLDGEAALPMLMPRLSSEWHTDAAKYNEKKHFDVVAGVFLSPVKGSCEGNLWVHPGSHIRERHAREASLGLNRERENLYRRRADGAALSSDESYDWRDAVPIQSERGGLILFDRDLVHAGGPNMSPNIRYALYFRLRFCTDPA